MNIARLIAVAIAATVAATAASAQTVGIGSTKGTAVGQMSAAISKVVSTHAGLQMRTQPMGGTQKYIPVVNAGELEFGVANSMQTYMAVNGIGLSQGHPYTNLRLVATLMTFRNGLIVRDDSGIKTFADLKGKRLPYGFKGAPLFRYFVRGFLANGGLTIGDVTEVPAIGLRQSWNLIKQGKIDGAVTAVGAGPTKEMNARIPSGVRFLDFDVKGPGGKRTLAILHKMYFTHVKPNPKLVAIKGPTNVMAYDFMLWTYKGMSGDVVAKVAKALYDHPGELRATSPFWRSFKSKNMGKDHGLPYHPAAIAFYKKMGVWTR